MSLITRRVLKHLPLSKMWLLQVSNNEIIQGWGYHITNDIVNKKIFFYDDLSNMVLDTDHIFDSEEEAKTVQGNIEI